MPQPAGSRSSSSRRSGRATTGRPVIRGVPFGWSLAMAKEHDLRLVDLWAATGPPWRGRFAADQFHPNDLGYESWTAAFLAALPSDRRHRR